MLIVVPAYNEEGGIQEVLAGVSRTKSSATR